MTPALGWLGWVIAAAQIGICEFIFRQWKKAEQERQQLLDKALARELADKWDMPLR